MALWGIDISNHQEGADLSKAKAAGCGFVFAKATEGLTWRDDHFAGFRAQAAKIGLPFGAYHFARPQAGRTGTDEARAFLAVAGKPTGLPHVLDLEATKTSAPATTAFALEWLATVHRATGVRPIIYTYTAFAASHLYPSTALAAYPLWLANYRSTPPPAPRPWKAWVAWQHTSSATVPGIPGRCDRNIAAPGFPPQTAQPKEWDEMATKAEVQQAVTDALNAYHPLNAADGQTIRNDIGYIRDQIRGDLSKMSADQIAAAVPDNLAQQVVDLLGARLNTTKGA